MICLLVITDGRLDYLRRCVTSAHEHLHGDIARRFMYDDTGDAEHRQILRGLYPEFVHIDAGPRQGFGGAIRAAWKHLRDIEGFDHVFHLEQDFTFNRIVAVDYMAALLDERRDLAQVALLRQPWNPQEKAAGGLIERYLGDRYSEQTSKLGCGYIEHDTFFTTNPCLYRRELMDHEWPDRDQSEGHFGIALKEAGYRFAYWGRRWDGPAVRHIGAHRVGTGY